MVSPGRDEDRSGDGTDTGKSIKCCFEAEVLDEQPITQWANDPAQAERRRN
jgi:hypothetical protein